MTGPTTPPPEPEAARGSGEGAAIIFRERLYAILRALREPEPTSGLRIGILSYNETVAYDAVVELVAERIADERHALAASRAEGATAERERVAGIVEAARRYAAAYRARAGALMAARCDGDCDDVCAECRALDELAHAEDQARDHLRAAAILDERGRG